MAAAVVILPTGPTRGETTFGLHGPTLLNERIFRSVEFEGRKLAAVSQWTRVLQRLPKLSAALTRCTADPANCVAPWMRSWLQVRAATVGLERAEQLQFINRFFNRWPYKSDRETYRAAEYWATPSEFMTYSGDCEDFAIAKFFALRELGFANHELRIAVVFDSLRQIGHAVLAVYTEDDILILNNQTDTIASHSRYGHFVPKYLVNETTLWTAALPTLGAIVSGTTAAAGPSGRRPSGATPRPSGGSAAPVRLRAPDTKGPA